MTTAPVLCAHCQAPVRGRSPADPRPLCRRERSVAWSGPDCAGLVGPEDGVPGLTWLAALDGLTWDAPEMVEAVTW